MNEIRIPAAQISASLADGLVRETGSTMAELASLTERTPNRIGARALPDTYVRLQTAVQRHITPARNIAAMVTGADPELRDEVVIIVGASRP